MVVRVISQGVVSTAWEFLLDCVYPPRCGGCGKRGALFCEECLRAVRRVTGAEPLRGIRWMASGGVFEGPLRNAIHNLKYEGDTPLARPLARLMLEAIEQSGWRADLNGAPPLIMPVPLHKAREKARGFNQSWLLAQELSRSTGWPAARDMVRARATATQVGLGAQERYANVRGAFAWSGADVPERVLLVDDVCTTGATLYECMICLKSAGVGDVFVVTAARAGSKGPEAGS